MLKKCLVVFNSQFGDHQITIINSGFEKQVLEIYEDAYELDLSVKVLSLEEAKEKYPEFQKEIDQIEKGE